MLASYHGLSADHLEHLSDSGIRAMAAAGTVAVLLLPDKPMASIADLKDIPAPPPVSYAPQTPGWWVVGGLILLGLLVYAFFRWRRWRRNRYRREAQAALDAIERAANEAATRKEALACCDSSRRGHTLARLQSATAVAP